MFVTAYNEAENRAWVDPEGHVILGGQYAVVSNDYPTVADALAAGRLVLIEDPGGNLEHRVSSPPLRDALRRTRELNGV
jgi:hypothetical protein